jgi:hypothetical protein
MIFSRKAWCASPCHALSFNHRTPLVHISILSCRPSSPPLSSPVICARSNSNNGTSHQSQTHSENSINSTRDKLRPSFHLLLETPRHQEAETTKSLPPVPVLFFIFVHSQRNFQMWSRQSGASQFYLPAFILALFLSGQFKWLFELVNFFFLMAFIIPVVGIIGVNLWVKTSVVQGTCPSCSSPATCVKGQESMCFNCGVRKQDTGNTCHTYIHTCAGSEDGTYAWNLPHPLVKRSSAKVWLSPLQKLPTALG